MAVNSQNNKKVSVVMCTYNGAKYIREQLDSILQQTYPIDEVIIRDDRSTDETIDILHAYMNQYSQIRLFVNEKRLGAHPNFMRALQDATGDFIAISDQDDIWELTKIERQMDCIGDHTLCFSLSQAFGDGVEADPECRVPNSNVLRMLFYPTIPGHAMLFRKEILSIIPNTDYIVYDLLIPLASDIYTNGGGIIACPEILNHHRRHINAFSYANPKDYRKTAGNILRYVWNGVIGYFQKKENIKNHFTKMHRLLLDFHPNKEDAIIKDALLFSACMADASLLSLLKASKICYRRRDDIFYSKTKDTLSLKIRALLCPLLCSEYY